MVCKNCGKENIDSIEKCVYCGHKLKGEEIKDKIVENDNYIENNVVEQQQVQNNNEQEVKKEKSGCVSALGIIAIFITLIFGFAVFSLFNTTCEGWDCLGRGLGIIIGFMVIIGVWFLYLAFAAIDSYEKKHKKHNDNKKSTSKLATIGKIVVILIPISLILGFNFLYGFFCFAFLIILEYILFKEWKENKKTTNLILPVILGILIVFISVTLVSNFISDTLRKKSEPEKNISYNDYVLYDMAKSVCQTSISTIYSTNDFKDSGIFECSDYNLYYVEKNKEKCGYYDCGNIYEIGYTYNEKIEEQFEGGIYFYRESKVVGYPSELKIVLEADSEEDLLNKYGEKLYNLAKNGNFDIIVYYTEKINDVNTAYDKLALLIYSYEVNLTQPSGMGTEYGNYVFYYAFPYDTLEEFFSDKNNYPSDIRDAIKFHRHIRFESNNKTYETLEDFINALNESFENGF